MSRTEPYRKLNRRERKLLLCAVLAVTIMWVLVGVLVATIGTIGSPSQATAAMMARSQVAHRHSTVATMASAHVSDRRGRQRPPGALR